MMGKLMTCSLACLVLALALPPTVAYTANEDLDQRHRPASPPAWTLAASPAEISPEEDQELAPSKGLGGATWMTIPAAAFAHDGKDAATYQFFRTGGYLLPWPSTTTYCGQAPVYLPHGAVVDQIWATVKDNDDNHDITISLQRAALLGSHSSDLMATLSSTGLPSNPIPKKLSYGVPLDQVVNFAQVDYSTHAYFLTTCFSGNTSLYSVRLFYSESEIFLDGFESGTTTAWSAAVGASAKAHQPIAVNPRPTPPARRTIAAMPAEIQDELQHKAATYGSPLVIPAADFVHDGFYGDELVLSTDGSMGGSGTGWELLAQAPAYLPLGATVSAVCSVLYDNQDGSTPDLGCNSIDDIFVWMYNSENDFGVHSTMTTTATTAAGASYQLICDNAPDFPAVVQEAQYYLATRLCSSEHRLYAVLIYYTGP